MKLPRPRQSSHMNRKINCDKPKSKIHSPVFRVNKQQIIKTFWYILFESDQCFEYLLLFASYVAGIQEQMYCTCTYLSEDVIRWVPKKEILTKIVVKCDKIGKGKLTLMVIDLPKPMVQRAVDRMKVRRRNL